MAKKRKESAAEVGAKIGKAIGKEIDKEIEKEKCGCGCESETKKEYKGGGGSAVYGLGFIGAAVYYISAATGFWMGVLGILKAIVWPAMLVYKAMAALGM